MVVGADDRKRGASHCCSGSGSATSCRAFRSTSTRLHRQLLRPADRLRADDRGDAADAVPAARRHVHRPAHDRRDPRPCSSRGPRDRRRSRSSSTSPGSIWTLVVIGGGTVPQPTQIFGLIAVIFAALLSSTDNDGWAFVASGFAIAAIDRPDLHRPVSERDGLEHQPRLQPDRQQRRLGPLLAGRDDGRRGDLRPGRARLPGLVVPRLPPARQRAARRRQRSRGQAGRPRPPGRMRALDPRLLRRTKSARPAAGSRHRARGRYRRGRAGAGEPAGVDRRAGVRREPGRARPVARLATAGDRFRLRGAFAWGMEIAGAVRPGASSRSFAWRWPRSDCGRSRSATDGAEQCRDRGRVRSRGSRGWRAYFARYLPQVVLASVVPLLVIVWVAFVDLASAVIMLLTLPLVPVFMWLIGRYTEQRTQERWQALRDPLQPLPRRRARPADAPGVRLVPIQATAVGEVSERYRSDDDARRSGSASCRGRCSSWRRRSASRWSR